LFGVTLQQLIGKVRDANREFVAGGVRDAGLMRTVSAGQTLRGVPDIGLLLLTTRDGRPVYVRDVARVVIGPSTAEDRVWNLTPAGEGWDRVPAVSLALAKRAGANAVVVAQDIRQRVDALRGRLIAPDIRVEVTRDYGKTANDKANELLFHLGLATVSIVVLIAFAVGWREAVVTLVVIPTTILLTLFAARLMATRSTASASLR
jgi:multidrug efflux pump subunit AcrB